MDTEMNPQYGIPEQKTAARTDDPHGRLYRSSPWAFVYFLSQPIMEETLLMTSALPSFTETRVGA